MKEDEVKEIVKETYGNIASCGRGCGLDHSLTSVEKSTQIGYSMDEVNAMLATK